jgi:hypothetical protein
VVKYRKYLGVFEKRFLKRGGDVTPPICQWVGAGNIGFKNRFGNVQK